MTEQRQCPEEIYSQKGSIMGFEIARVDTHYLMVTSGYCVLSGLIYGAGKATGSG